MNECYVDSAGTKSSSLEDKFLFCVIVVSVLPRRIEKIANHHVQLMQ